MKVLKKGTKKPGWHKELKCTGGGNGGFGCEAILLVEQSDVYRTQSHHYDGSSESYLTFKCPECNRETDINELGDGFSYAFLRSKPSENNGSEI